MSHYEEQWSVIAQNDVVLDLDDLSSFQEQLRAS